MRLTIGVEGGADNGLLTNLEWALRSHEPPVAGGTRRNRDWLSPWVEWEDGVSDERRWLLCDAMTSGGLLVAAGEDSGAPGVRIGRLVEGRAGAIAVRG